MESVLSCEMISKKFLSPGDERLLIWVCLLFILRGVRWGRERNVTGAGWGVPPNNLVSDNSENNINISLYSDSKNSTSRPWLDTLAHFHGTGERGTLSERNHWVCLSWPVWDWGWWGDSWSGHIPASSGAGQLSRLLHHPTSIQTVQTDRLTDRQYRQTNTFCPDLLSIVATIGAIKDSFLCQHPHNGWPSSDLTFTLTLEGFIRGWAAEIFIL